MAERKLQQRYVVFAWPTSQPRLSLIVETYGIIESWNGGVGCRNPLMGATWKGEI